MENDWIYNIQEPSSFFKNTFVYPIDIIDIFPNLKIGLTNQNVINKLQLVLGKRETEQKCCRNFCYLMEVIEVNKESAVADILFEYYTKLCNIHCNNVFGIYNLTKVSKVVLSDKSFDIYDLLEVGKIILQEKYYPICRNTFVERVLRHPKVDPLLGSILYGNIGLVEHYLDDVRGSKIKAYKQCRNENSFVSNIVRDSLMLKLFLIKQAISHNDIYYLLVKLEIF